MSYQILGTGPQFPEPYKIPAETAADALNKRQAVEELCGQASVLDANGREIPILELRRLAHQEKRIARR
jgi:hypothetical protein